MKIALAQIDMRLGDIDAICERIYAQAELALEQGAGLLCTPAPLFAGTLPGTLIASTDFEHDLLAGLSTLAERLAEKDIICLVPAAAMYQDSPLFEVFVLKAGRVIPARSAAARSRDGHGIDTWAPPLFEVGGIRGALTFEPERDLPNLPQGIDLVVAFQVNAFDASDSSTAGVAGLPDSKIGALVREKSLWFAQMAAVGAYDEATYVGGSYVLDDSARVVAAAPCFEEALLVQEILRGETLPMVDECVLPSFNREEFLWRALVSELRAAARVRGVRRAVVALEGDLQSSLAAALAVAAFGPRNVVGIAMGCERGCTPAQLAAECERMELARASARGLGIRVIEREDASRALVGDALGASELTLRMRILGLYLEEAARSLDAMVVSSLTKTDYALAAPLLAPGYCGDVAPFGDIYLSALEFVAHARNRSSQCVPAPLATLASVEESIAAKVELGIAAFKANEPQADRLRQLLAPLDPSDIDAVLEAHVDKNLAFDDIPLAQSRPEAVALLLMMVRKGESARRMLPAAPIVSARSFAERMWPRQLAWSDMGLRGAERLSVDDLVEEELARDIEEGSKAGDAARAEFMRMLGNVLGLSSDQVEELQSDEAQQRMRQNMDKFESQVEDAINEMLKHGGELGQGPQAPGQMFFSLN